ncbi:MAG: hypothetical protein SGJ27_30865 [Candidatus Melainabacteria bacterium]|nr:hypothetical protein [Candidatus Melainabacteria bacterium]
MVALRSTRKTSGFVAAIAQITPAPTTITATTAIAIFFSIEPLAFQQSGAYFPGIPEQVAQTVGCSRTFNYIVKYTSCPQKVIPTSKQFHKRYNPYYDQSCPDCDFVVCRVWRRVWDLGELARARTGKGGKNSAWHSSGADYFASK